MNDRNSFIILSLIIERCLITFDEGFFSRNIITISPWWSSRWVHYELTARMINDIAYRI